MMKRSDQIGEMFKEALANRAKRPSDLLSTYSYALKAAGYFSAVRRVCEDYLNDKPHAGPPAAGFYEPVDVALSEARDEEAALRQLIVRIEAELGMWAPA